MKKILITGASGMLGTTLVKLLSKKYLVYATAGNDFLQNPAKNFKKFDLKTKNYKSLYNWVKPNVIVHCAALTSHEYCQSNPKEAMLVNGDSVKKLIKVFPEIKLIFISTDAVFPLKTHLANEKTKTSPVTTYGKSKELGERYLLSLAKNSCIVRTTIVGKNINSGKQSFAEWIVNSIKKGNKITLYGNTMFTPISIWNLAKELEWIIKNKVPTILHIAGREIVSKYDFGYNLCKELNLDLNLITKGKLNQKKEKIKRSEDQTLDCSLYQKLSGHKLPNLEKTLKNLYKYFK